MYSNHQVIVAQPKHLPHFVLNLGQLRSISLIISILMKNPKVEDSAEYTRFLMTI